MTVTCPKCQRFLADASGYVRAVCANCGTEVAVTPKDARKGLPA